MNQTRSFLLIAWLFVAALLWMEWSKGPAPDAPPANDVAAAPGAASASLPASTDGNTSTALPGSDGVTPPSSPVADASAASAAPGQAIVLENDVLKLSVDLNGGAIVDSRLLQYTVEKKPGSPQVRLLSTDPQHFYQAEAGLIRVDAGKRLATVPEAFRTADGRSEYRLSEGADAVRVELLASEPETGLQMRRTLTLRRGSYVVELEETVANQGAAQQQLYPYVALQRVAPPPPPKHSGLTNPESFSFVGAAWYDPEHKYATAKFADFAGKQPLDQAAKGGWIAMLQHHFLAAWVPDPAVAQKISLATGSHGAAPSYSVRSLYGSLELAPGASQSHHSKLWLGPKLQKPLAAVAPDLDRAIEYSRFDLLALLADGLFWILSALHALIGNWGWAIIAIVVLLKLVLYPLSAAQYRSMAKMRAVQPRIEALKERYGDDRQQFQMAMMELYKKEKINPVGGCLPMLIPFPIFIALYDLLLESVEFRHAPWMGWIQNLTAPDPYFILPVLNLAVMFLTQKLTPTPGMDPMQKKMMQFMPLVFGVMMAFFPAGLVLYWVTNGLLGLAQQWWMTKQHGDRKPATVK